MLDNQVDWLSGDTWITQIVEVFTSRSARTGLKHPDYISQVDPSRAK